MPELHVGYSEWVKLTLKRELRRRELGVRLVKDAGRAPSCLNDVRFNLAKNKEIVVWTGASDNTIFDSPETNWAMRALHDLWHVDCMGEMDLLGEMRVHFHAVDNGLVPLALWNVFAADGIGQSVYHVLTGKFPDNQRAFVAELVKWIEAGHTIEDGVRGCIGGGL